MRRICFAILLLLAPPVHAQPAANHVIYGIVRLPNGEPASRVTVRVTSQSGLDWQVFSDDMGRYEIRDLPRGRYHVNAVNPADPNQFTEAVEADTGRSFSGRLLVHIYLRYRATAEPVREKGGAMVSVAEATQHIPRGALKAFEQAIKFRSNKKLEQALGSLGKAIELYPAYFQALAERGHLKIAMGQMKEAAEDFARALELDPRYGPALRGSGICKFQQEKFAEAIEDLESAIAVEPNVSKSFLFLGVSYLALDRRELARAALQKALNLDPEGSSRARVHLANLYLKENRLQEAADELHAYLTAVPASPDAEKLRAIEAQLRSQLRKP